VPICRRAISILVTLQEGIQLWDDAGCLVYANPASRSQFPTAEVLAPGRHWTALARDCRTESGAPCSIDDFPVADVLRGAAIATPLLLRVTRHDGQPSWLRLAAHRLPMADGGPDGVVSVSVDVTALVEQELRLKQQAHFDPLTDLPNRALFSDRIERAVAHARRHGERLAVCLLDLDGFKAVNDELGHPAGDLLLRKVARRLKDTLRTEDTAARIGGDEFALLLGDLNAPGECESVLKRILDALAIPYPIADREVRVTASIGATVFPIDAVDPDQLLRHADHAMYTAKLAGKNRFSLFDPTQESRARANFGLIRKIEDALAHGQFTLHYQPKVDCRQGRVIGLEALLRWQHPVLGLRMPGEFLPLIEHEDVIVSIGNWVIAEALREQTRLRAAGHDLSISVNIAARQLLRGRFADQFDAILAEHAEADPGRLEIEILETAALEDVAAVGQLIADFQGRGVRFALDDFGTGYSSLAHLKHLRADVLKIDQTFVRDMLDDPGDLAIVQGVVGLAGAFHRDVVAEGVENLAHVRALLGLGCHVMQGYGISRPLPAEHLGPWLAGFRPDPGWTAARAATHH
jgi:diguanylate cyclase (GGDEF)-like protein